MAEKCPVCGEYTIDGICPDCGGSSGAEMDGRTEELYTRARSGGYKVNEKEFAQVFSEKNAAESQKSLKELIFSKKHLWKFILGLILPVIVFIPVYFMVGKYKWVKCVTAEQQENRRVITALAVMTLLLTFVWIVIGVKFYMRTLSFIQMPL